jgi:hypothetical protein
LVGYFNDRFGREHRSSFRPFILKDNKVSGLFGPIRINSLFSPIRETLKPTAIVGHTAQIEVSTYATQPLYDDELENLLAHDERQPTNLESIINFDRLSRTVHMLNYLPLLPSHSALFLEVDPRHILGIKQDHGVYFEEVIAQCGLQTNNVVIVLSMHKQYTRYYQPLLAGLGNYRQQGYQIALKFDYRVRDKTVLDLITTLAPNYVSVSAKNLDLANDSAILDNLDELTTTVASASGQSILQQIDQQKTDSLARNAHFYLVEGRYYRAIAFDYLANVETSTSQLERNYV